MSGQAVGSMNRDKPAMISGAAMGQASVPAILLAAGASTRLGQPKQLLRPAIAAGRTMLEHAVQLAQHSGFSPVLVVLGADADTIRNATDLSLCIVVENPDWKEGMASSIRAGVRAVMAQRMPPTGVGFMVCDQPALTSNHLQRLLAVHAAEPEKAAVSRYAGRHGVPAILPSAMFPALLALTGDRGAGSLWQRQDTSVCPIDFPGGEWDIDTMDDFRQFSQFSG